MWWCAFGVSANVRLMRGCREQKPGAEKDIIYGCTELLSPDAFQEQIATLARSGGR